MKKFMLNQIAKIGQEMTADQAAKMPETPRTDALWNREEWGLRFTAWREHALQLERELAEAQALVLEVEQRCGDAMMKLANCEERCRALAANNARLRGDLRRDSEVMNEVLRGDGVALDFFMFKGAKQFRLRKLIPHVSMHKDAKWCVNLVQQCLHEIDAATAREGDSHE